MYTRSFHFQPSTLQIRL
jgi:molecular chaperone DnaJ